MNLDHNDELYELLTNEDFKKWVLDPSPERDLFWQKWIRNHPEKTATVNKAREFIRSVNFNELTLENDEKSEILSKIISESTPFFTQKHPDIAQKSKQFFTVYAFKLAAAAIVVAGFLGILYWNFGPGQSTDFYSESTFIKKETGPGKRGSFHLPDGSLVTLNANSSISYDAEFSENNRTIHLSGEAFFEVKKDSTLPFRVITGNFVTTALGTSFNILARTNSNSYRIALRTGKIKVTPLTTSTSFQSHLLNPGEGLRIDHDGSTPPEKYVVKDVIEFGWKDGILIFDDNSMEEVIDALEKWYGVTITVVGNPERYWRINAQFENESLEQVLQGLSFTYDLTYTIQENYVELNFDYME